MSKSNGWAAAILRVKTLAGRVPACKAWKPASQYTTFAGNLTERSMWRMRLKFNPTHPAHGVIRITNGGRWLKGRYTRYKIGDLPRRLQYTAQFVEKRQLRCLSSKTSKTSQLTKSQDQPLNSKPSLPRPLQSLMPTHENIYTLPNFLTLTRLIAAPVVGYLLVYEQYPAALGLFLYAGITDLVDGWIARRWNLQTVVGTVVDPMADKSLMTIVVVVLAVKGALPVSLATIILGRDALLGISALYYRYISLPPPKTLGRYWDFSLPSAEVKPTEISKWNTFFQLGLIGATMLELAIGGFPATDLEIMGFPITGTNALELSWWIVGGTTIWSGLSYVGGRKGLRILSRR